MTEIHINMYIFYLLKKYTPEYSGVLFGVEKVPFFTPESRSGESTKFGGSPQHCVLHSWFSVQKSATYTQFWGFEECEKCQDALIVQKNSKLKKAKTFPLSIWRPKESITECDRKNW